jgi:hypothetical protein
MIPRPLAIGMTLCDYVIIEERTRKVSLIGSFSGLSAADFPALAQPFSVFSVLTDSLGDGTIDLVVSSLDNGEQIHSYRSELHFPDKLAEVVFHARLRQCSFPRAGEYQFTLFADGEWLAQRRLRVYLRGGLS